MPGKLHHTNLTKNAILYLSGYWLLQNFALINPNLGRLIEFLLSFNSYEVGKL